MRRLILGGCFFFPIQSGSPGSVFPSLFRGFQSPLQDFFHGSNLILFSAPLEPFGIREWVLFLYLDCGLAGLPRDLRSPLILVGLVLPMKSTTVFFEFF